MKGVWKSIIFLLLGILVFSPGLADAEESYQTEFFASSSRVKRDDGSESKSKKLIMAWHFRPVKTEGHPLAEAGFLEHIGTIQLLLGMSETKFTSGLDGFGPFYGVLLNLRKPEWPMTLLIGLTQSEFEFDAPVNAHDDGDVLTFGIGAFLNETFHLGLEYIRSDVIRTGIDPSGPQKFSFETDRYRIVSKFVLELDRGRAMNILANITSSRFDFPNGKSSNKSRSFSVDYYFNPRLSLGGGFGKSETGKSYSVRTRAFIKPPFSIFIGFSKFLADDPEGDSQSPDLFLSGRF